MSAWKICMQQLDENCGRTYVCMENIYAAAGFQTEVDGIEAFSIQNNARGHFPDLNWVKDISDIKKGECVVCSFYIVRTLLQHIPQLIRLTRAYTYYQDMQIHNIAILPPYTYQGTRFK